MIMGDGQNYGSGHVPRKERRMIEEMGESGGNVVGYRVSGTVGPEDYQALVPRFEELVGREGAVRVLMDVTGFKTESPSAWRADLHFGREFHGKIERLAIVGEKWWEKLMARFCAPFYAKEARYFHTDDIPAAWEWLRG